MKTKTTKFKTMGMPIISSSWMHLLFSALCIFNSTGCTDSNDYDNPETNLSPTTSTWVLSSLSDISSYQSASPSSEVTLNLAKGEYEHFQLVLQAEQDTEFSIERLDKTDGLEINYRTFTQFEGHEDVLIPCNGVIKTSGKLAKLWITYHAIPQATAGKYNETLVFTSGMQKFYIWVTIEVHDITIPETSSITLLSGIYTSNLMVENSSSTEYENKYREMTDLLLSYRISPFSNIWPAVSSPYNWSDPRTMSYLSDKRFTNIALPYFSLSNEDLKNMFNLARQNGLLSKSYVYLWDEPTSSEEYIAIKACSNIIKLVAPDVKILTTFYAGLGDQTRDINKLMKTFDSLRGSVQIFCTGYWALQNNELYAQKCREKILPGEEWWTYACMNDKPGLSYNSSPIENRVVLWRCWKEQNTGFLYWSVNGFANTNPLTSHPHLPAGDGILVYPGKPFGEKNPVVSVRLERWRDGAEDYELLTLMEKKKGRASAQALLQSVYQNPMQYTNNPKTVELFKTNLIHEIEL